MFSPYYAAARRRGAADPRDHCALNVCLYGQRGKHWSLTERRRTSLIAAPDHLTLGDSTLQWDGQSLRIDISELAIPRLSPIRGVVRVYPDALTDCTVQLDAEGRHTWRPFAPRARVDLQMTAPSLRWCGSGYFDSNAGSRPLEDDFISWTWSRSETEDGAAILYDVRRRRQEPMTVALRFNGSGGHESFTPPAPADLPATGWRIARTTRSEDRAARVIRTLEDTPFYARSAIASKLFGRSQTSMHESLSLDRFKTRWVQALLPFRMPRSFR